MFSLEPQRNSNLPCFSGCKTYCNIPNSQFPTSHCIKFDRVLRSSLGLGTGPWVIQVIHSMPLKSRQTQLYQWLPVVYNVLLHHQSVLHCNSGILLPTCQSCQIDFFMNGMAIIEETAKAQQSFAVESLN